MRFKTPIPVLGTQQYASGFLWLPVSLIRDDKCGGTIKETRWLETGTWMQEWTNGGSFKDHWKKKRWIIT